MDYVDVNKKAIRAFEGRTKLDAEFHLRKVLGDCLTCSNRHKCTRVGASSVCGFTEESAEQVVLHLSLVNNTKPDSRVNRIS